VSLRFGVVGCGAIVTLHQLPALRRCAQVELVGLVDRDVDWARKLAGRFGVPHAHEDAEALVGAVDAVLVATPNTTHADIACRLLERGVHVLCEKPLATTRAEVERMLAAASRGGARLMAAHCLRFSAQFQALKRLVAGGALGSLREFRAAIGAPYDGGAQRTDFRRQRGLAGGGALLDLGVHVLDLAAWLVGQPAREVHGTTSSLPGWEVETDAELAVLYEGGAAASIEASFSRFLENGVSVRGSAGWARASLYVPTELSFFSEASRITRRAGVQTLVLEDAGMYDVQIAHFCEAIRTGAPVLVADAEVRSTIDVVDRCYLREAA
jgi:predicted dehydrogenase